MHRLFRVGLWTVSPNCALLLRGPFAMLVNSKFCSTWCMQTHDACSTQDFWRTLTLHLPAVHHSFFISSNQLWMAAQRYFLFPNKSWCLQLVAAFVQSPLSVRVLSCHCPWLSCLAVWWARQHFPTSAIHWVACWRPQSVMDWHFSVVQWRNCCNEELCSLLVDLMICGYN